MVVSGPEERSLLIDEIKTVIPAESNEAEVRLTEDEWISRYNNEFHVTMMVADHISSAEFLGKAAEILLPVQKQYSIAVQLLP